MEGEGRRCAIVLPAGGSGFLNLRELFLPSGQGEKGKREGREERRISCRRVESLADLSTVPRLVNFDIKIDEGRMTDTIRASLDAARQLLALPKVQKLLIPADHFHDEPSDDLDKETLDVAAHLKDLTIQVFLEQFKSKEAASLAISQAFERGFTMHLNSNIFRANLTGLPFQRYGNLSHVLPLMTSARLCVARRRFSTRLSMPRAALATTNAELPRNSSRKVPARSSLVGSFCSRLRSSTPGFAFTDVLFGGDLLPLLGNGKEMGSATETTMSDPTLYEANLRFAPANLSSKPKQYYLVDDEWCRNFVRDIASGGFAPRLAKALAKDILLLPKTINAAFYTPPTPAQVAATCYRRIIEDVPDEAPTESATKPKQGGKKKK